MIALRRPDRAPPASQRSPFSASSSLPAKPQIKPVSIPLTRSISMLGIPV